MNEADLWDRIWGKISASLSREVNRMTTRCLSNNRVTPDALIALSAIEETEIAKPGSVPQAQEKTSNPRPPPRSDWGPIVPIAVNSR
jgi:hypothetical protein